MMAEKTGSRAYEIFTTIIFCCIAVVVIITVFVVLSIPSPIEHKQINTTENTTMHSARFGFLFQTRDTFYNIAPGCYTIDAETLDPESSFVATIGGFKTKTTITDRFGNAREEWISQPPPEGGNTADSLLNIGYEICSSDAYSVCHETIHPAEDLAASGITVADLKILARCNGNCWVNISKCSETKEEKPHRQKSLEECLVNSSGY